MAKDEAVENGTPDEPPREPGATPPTGSPSGSRRRPPPTIDLAAKDVSPDEPPEAPIDTDATDQPDASPDYTDQTRPRRPLGLLAGLVIALVSGLIGGALAFVIATAFFAPVEDVDALTDLEARVVDLRQRTGALESRPAPEPAAPVDTSAIDNRLESLSSSIKAVQDKVAALEAAPAPVAAPAPAQPDLPADLGARLDAVEALAKQANSAAEKPAASPEALAAFGQQLTTLEQHIAQLGTATETAEKSRATAAAAAQLAAVQTLRAAIAAGTPFAEQLAAARKLIGAPAEVLAPIEVYAATGLPDGAQLAKRLAVQEKSAAPTPAPAAEAPAAAPAGEGFLDKLARSAGNLVSVKKVTDAGAPEETPADYAPLAAALNRNDAAAAQTALAALPEAERAAATPVVAEFVARNKALTDIDTISRQLLAALAGSAP